MCEDCGCREGNERAYFAREGHTHSHVHADGTAEIHIHIHMVKAGEVAVHLHEHADHEHSHAHGHDHSHDHEHSHAHDHEYSHEHEHSHVDGGFTSQHKRTRTIELETSVLALNDRQAEINREWLARRGVVAVNLISSPGSGKTFLLERTLEMLRGRVPHAVITGDQQTVNDARRMQGKGAKVVQIETRSACHLNAQQVFEQLDGVVGDGVKLLFIENVGNLVCPAAFDLGEQNKIALVSVPEGEDKPVKYPVLFHDAPVTVITKTDLLPHLDVDIARYRANIKKVRPDARIFEVSAKTGEGMEAWISWLEGLAAG